MDMELYDEFGNYIGPEMDDSGSEGSDDGRGYGDDAGAEDEYEENRLMSHGEDGDAGGMDIADDENRIVLHEDKKYYPDAEEVYPGVRTVTLDEDAQDITEPIIKPIKEKKFSLQDTKGISTNLNYGTEFMATLMQNPRLIRNIALLGNFHHGKTVFVDTLVQAVQEEPWDPTMELRFTDMRKDEQSRELSIKSTPLSLVMENLNEKSYLLNIFDTPGHVNFCDEYTAALRAADGAVICIDAIEGVMMTTERQIKHALSNQVAITVLINKVDRLILELKLPPQDAYYKITHTLEEVNNIIATHAQENGLPTQQRMNPASGNVCFSSGQHRWSFTLNSFAQKYCEKNPGMNPDDMAVRLWGDWYFDENNRAFTKNKPDGSTDRTFVRFILEPIYKIYSLIIGESPQVIVKSLKKLGIVLKLKEASMDPKPLMKLVMSKFFGYPRGFVDMIVKHVPSPLENAHNKTSSIYTGYQTSDVAKSMHLCDAKGPLMINIVKLISDPEGSKFSCLGRVFSGSVESGQKVKVLGESFTEDDDEDMAVLEVGSINMSVGRFVIEVNSATAGNWVLLEGLDSAIKKTATITDLQSNEVAIFKPFQFDSMSAIKLAVEPLNPSELPKMTEALRRINKSYPLVTTRVEESGEHIIFGTGELYMDCIMHDIRHLYSDIEVKVADPVVAFRETVVETSTIQCISETPNKLNKFAMLAEPLESGLAEDLESGAVRTDMDKKTITNFFQSNYDWDLLAVRSIWAFGPDECGPNLLMDDTLPTEVDKKLLNTVRESVVQGFRWGCREGPLCDEPIRNVKFKILDTTIASQPIHRGGGQIIPTSRRVAYSAFLLGSPRLMEPVYRVEIQAPADCIQNIYPVLARRRGHIVQDTPKPGAPFYTVKAFIPCVDSFGFETDLRSYTQGQAFCQQVFDHWSVVPGDPLDRNIILHPLEPSPPPALARDFMVKTRRRKGLSEDVSINKYFDDSMMMELAKLEAEMNAY